MRSMSCTTDEKAGLTETGPGFGDLDHLNVRSNVIGCGVHGVHGVHQASLQCTSRSTESSRAPIFPLDIFGSSLSNRT